MEKLSKGAAAVGHPDKIDHAGQDSAEGIGIIAVGMGVQGKVAPGFLRFGKPGKGVGEPFMPVRGIQDIHFAVRQIEPVFVGGIAQKKVQPVCVDQKAHHTGGIFAARAWEAEQEKAALIGGRAEVVVDPGDRKAGGRIEDVDYIERLPGFHTGKMQIFCKIFARKACLPRIDIGGIPIDHKNVGNKAVGKAGASEKADEIGGGADVLFQIDGISEAGIGGGGGEHGKGVERALQIVACGGNLHGVVGLQLLADDFIGNLKNRARHESGRDQKYEKIRKEQADLPAGQKVFFHMQNTPKFIKFSSFSLKLYKNFAEFTILKVKFPRKLHKILVHFKIKHEMI